MVLSDLTANLTEWFILKEAVKQEEVKEEVKQEEVFIVLINNKPYGYYYSEDETNEQIEQAKEHIMSRHSFDFNKFFYWNELQAEGDTVAKIKLVSNIKDIFVKYDSVEDSLEIVKSKLLRKL
jgi:hypothetical protein